MPFRVDSGAQIGCSVHPWDMSARQVAAAVLALFVLIVLVVHLGTIVTWICLVLAALATIFGRQIMSGVGRYHDKRRSRQ